MIEPPLNINEKNDLILKQQNLITPLRKVIKSVKPSLLDFVDTGYTTYSDNLLDLYTICISKNIKDDNLKIVEKALKLLSVIK